MSIAEKKFSSFLWTFQEMAQALIKGGVPFSNGFNQPFSIEDESMDLLSDSMVSLKGVQDIVLDSRQVKEGDLFLALGQGEKWKPGAFVKQALQGGAHLIWIRMEDATEVLDLVAEKDREKIWIFQNVLSGLRILAETARQRFVGKCLGLTASVGKTTVKEALVFLLKAMDQGDVFSNPGSFNNHLGTPLSLARLPRQAAWGIFELGMNHAGEIQDLVHLVKPHVSAVFNVSAQHIQHFSGEEDIARAKAEIFQACQDKQGILHRDSPHFDLLRAEGEKQGISGWTTFGEHPEADLRLLKISKGFRGMVQVQVSALGKEIIYLSPDRGDHWILSSLAAGACLMTLGIDLERAMAHWVHFNPPAGRGNQLFIGGITVIDQSYNAAPEAMKMVLKSGKNLYDSTQGRFALALGSMRELGSYSQAAHESLIPLIQELKPDFLWLCGEEMAPVGAALKKERSHVFWSPTVFELISPVIDTLCSGDFLLIKGARGMKLFALVDALYRYYGEEDKANGYPLFAYLG